MAIEDQIMQDLTPGMRITVSGASKRYHVVYSTAARALRRLYKQEFVFRHYVGRRDVRLEYEGKQERLI